MHIHALVVMLFFLVSVQARLKSGQGEKICSHGKVRAFQKLKHGKTSSVENLLGSIAGIISEVDGGSNYNTFGLTGAVLDLDPAVRGSFYDRQPVHRRPW